MVKEMRLNQYEKRTYRMVHQDGLIDISAAVFIAGFAFVPLLNDLIQDDFWSSMLLLPVYFLVLWLYRLGKKNITAPRIGVIRYSMQRKSKSSLVLLTTSILLGLALITGALFATRQPGNPWLFSLLLSGFVLIGFNVAAMLMDLLRFSLYGVLMAAAGPIGEWLWNQYGISHHGIPLTYGLTAAIILVIGIILFIRFLQKYQIPEEDQYERQS